jgi:hypothetical protein
MNAGKLLLLGAALLALAGCETALNPTLTPEEKAVLSFSVDGVTIGGKPGQLAIFPQVQHIPIKLGGYDVYEVFNASPNISQIKAWYFNDKLKRIELRYFNGPGVNTLSRAGGWDGIRNYLMQKFGPPSRFGSDVPILATKGEWNVKYAKFNGEWIFSRIHRQINYSAMADANGGIGVVTVMDTTPVPVPKTVGMAPAPAPAAKTTVIEPAPQEVKPSAPNPGF